MRAVFDAAMSQLGHERPIGDGRATSACPPIAIRPLRRTKRRFGPIDGWSTAGDPSSFRQRGETDHCKIAKLPELMRLELGIFLVAMIALVVIGCKATRA